MKESKNVNVYIQYLPLVKKIVHQFLIKIPKSSLSTDEIKDMEGAAWEGLSLGLHKFEQNNETGTTLLTFLSYQIKFSILNYIQNESRTVRISSYRQGIMKHNGESGFKKNLSLDNDHFKHNMEDTEEQEDQTNSHWNKIYGNIEEDIVDYEAYANSKDDVLYQQIVNTIQPETEVQYRNINILCEDFGICGFEKLERKVICKKYGITDGNISIIIKKLIGKLSNNEYFKQYLRRTFLS